MTKNWDKPILLELGQATIKYYTSFWGKNCDKLDSQIDDLRIKLRDRGIILPHISRITNFDELKGRTFRIRFAAAQTEILSLDLPSITPLTKLEEIACSLMIDGEISSKSVCDLLLEGIAQQENQNYNMAMERYRKVYYWSLCLNDSDDFIRNEDVFFSAVYNMGYIQLINNRYGAAVYCGEVLLNIVDAESYNNIAEKYLAHTFLANAYWLCGEEDKAIALYCKSINDIQHYPGKEEPLIYSLWSLAFACMQSTGFSVASDYYDLCRKALQDLCNLLYVYEKEKYSNAARYFADLYMHVAEEEIGILKNEVAQLRSRIGILENKLRPLQVVGAVLTYAKNMVTIVPAILPRTINISDNITTFSQVQATVNGQLQNHIYGEVTTAMFAEISK